MPILMELPPSTCPQPSRMMPEISIVHSNNEHMNDAKAEKLHKKAANGMLMEDDKPVIPGIVVRAATFDALAEFCIQCFDPSGNVSNEHASYPRVFFLMHKWFSTTDQVVSHLIKLYHDAEDTCSLRCLCRHLVTNMANCCVCQYRSRVCHAIRYWIETFPMHFDLEPSVVKLKEFQIELHNNEKPLFSALVDISNIPSYDWMRIMSVRNPIQKHNRKVSLVFNHLEPDELAEHLTFLEHKILRRINFQDLKSYAISGRLKENTKLERSIALFNGLSQWIQCMVLSKTTPQHRADVIVKFVNVAKHLLELQNFNTLMAVVGGLSHSAIARLSKTMSCIPAETQKKLIDMTDLLSSASNFANYRKALSECTKFYLPVLGVHMKDLISLHVALPDYIDDKLINFRKIVQLSFIFQELAELQTSTTGIEANLDLVNTLRLSLDLAYTEDEIYELSLAKEPRNSVSGSPCPRPEVFAEWAAGITITPDPVVIKKHIHAMVEAVFKNYDNDRDGYISQEEFEAISGNFPFVDSFCVLDADQDGMISKAEMRDYFIRANCHAFRNGFKHDFHETNYFKPTYCAHCAGLLWGLIKQGFKCKDCAINAHKHCKDLIVMECRKTHSVSPHGRSMSVSGTSDATVSRAKFKNRRRHQKSFPVDGEPLLNSVPNGTSDGSNDESSDSLLHQRLAQSEEVQNSDSRATFSRKHSIASSLVSGTGHASSLERTYGCSASAEGQLYSQSDGNSQQPERFRSMSS